MPPDLSGLLDIAINGAALFSGIALFFWIVPPIVTGIRDAIDRHFCEASYPADDYGLDDEDE